MMFKGALFDLDGVIADTASLHFDAWRQIILKHFEVSIPDTIEEKTKGVSREDSLRVILEHLNISISDYDFMNLCEEKNKLYVKSLERPVSYTHLSTCRIQKWILSISIRYFWKWCKKGYCSIQMFLFQFNHL